MTIGSLVRHPQPSGRVYRRDFDRLMDDLRGGFGLAPVAFAPQTAFAPQPTCPPQPTFPPQTAQPTFDAVELEKEYRVTADIPGVEPADLEVSVEDGVLTVRGHRQFGEGKGEKEEKEEKESEAGGLSRVDERGRFERRIRFPAEIVEDAVKASYKHGVLTVAIPKPEEVKPEVRTIPIETA